MTDTQNQAANQPATPQSVVQENAKRWARVVAQAWADENFKKRLADNPAAVLRENGFNVPAGVDVRIVENTDKVAYLTLPPKPAADAGELNSEQLANVVGGFCCCSTCVTATPTQPVNDIIMTGKLI